MSYEVEPFPDDPKLLSEYLRRQLERIAASFKMVSGVQLDELHAAPAKPRTGMIVLADGTNWNPGTGQGVYAYYANAWNKLQTAIGADDVTVFMGSDTGIGATTVDLCNTGSIGAAGEKWDITGVALLGASSATATVVGVSIHDGTNAVAGGGGVMGWAQPGWPVVSTCKTGPITLSGPTTFTLRGTGNASSAAAYAIGYSNTGLATATFISARRLT